MKRPIAIASAALLLGLACPLALAQDPSTPDQKPAARETQPKDEGSLQVGDSAPALKVEKWIKGDPIAGFEKGKIYVVEFWATWCGPCVKGMPHLSKLQKEYKDRNVTIIGINIWEDQAKPNSAETLAKVTKFVKTSKDMKYTVAFDGAAKAMDKAYMKAAGRQGIPSAFLVDGEGKIAWIGHPGELDAELAKVAKANSAKEKAEGEKAKDKAKDKTKDKPKDKG